MEGRGRGPLAPGVRTCCQALDEYGRANKGSISHKAVLGTFDCCPTLGLIGPCLRSWAVSPRSLKVMKRQLWDALFEGLRASLADADHEMALSLKSDDFKEGVAHFLEKRQARFTGR